MSTAVQATRYGERFPNLPLHRLTVEQYHRMIETGVLTENDRVELLDGWIVDKMPHNPPHDGTIGRLNRRLIRLLPDEWLVRVQSAITLSRSEPEPDLVIIRGPDETYFKRHPKPRDIAVIIEVSESTLEYDRDYKGMLYAQARIPEYWIINLVALSLEVYTQPKGGNNSHYRHRRDIPPPEAVPLILDGNRIADLPIQDFFSLTGPR